MLFFDDLTHYIRQQDVLMEELRNANIPDWGMIAKVLGPGPQTADGAQGYPVNHEVDGLEVDAEGILGDRHHRATRPSSARERAVYPKGTLIRQHRHLCIVSRSDCRVLSDRLGVEVTPELLGANVVIDRQDGADFSISALPSRTHLLVLPEGADEVSRPPLATIVHFVKQWGCGVVGKAIADHYGDPSLVRAFREQAQDHRGLICSIEYPVASSITLCAGQSIAFRFSRDIAP